MPNLSELGALAELARRQGWYEPEGVPVENDEAFSAAAGKTRRRHPSVPSERALKLSQMPWSFVAENSQLGRLFGDPMEQSGRAALGVDYDPIPVVGSAIGAAASPVKLAGRGLSTLGSGLFRRSKALQLPEPGSSPLWFWGGEGGKQTPRIGLGTYDETTPRRILSRARGGGYSVNLPTGDVPTEGLMMGLYRNDDPRNFVGKPTLANIGQFAERNLAALQLPGRHFGAWVGPDDVTYLDVAQRFPQGDRRAATKFGERSAQLKGYDIGKKEEFPVGNWPDFIKGPEFRGRVEQMAREGGQYLEQFPQREWWNMYGSPFEEVYGAKNLPQVAGFSASTAPNTSPIPNMQHMSEYVRRFIRGEPVVQPGWRAPPGLMSLAEGSQMPLEASRVANLEKTARGELSQLSRDKVRSEAAAMMGDPNAMVFDRHWARVAEKPSEGIFTASQEGVVPSERTVGGRSGYQQMEDVVGPIAREAGRDPRDFTADAWTGIRNTIQRTNELFGEPFRGAAIAGESKSYADIFTDVVRDKAAHMGISVKELHKRLEGGDASLLSALLGTPMIAEVFRQWQEGGQGRSGPASSAQSPSAAPPLRQ